MSNKYGRIQLSREKSHAKPQRRKEKTNNRNSRKKAQKAQKNGKATEGAFPDNVDVTEITTSKGRKGFDGWTELAEYLELCRTITKSKNGNRKAKKEWKKELRYLSCLLFTSIFVSPS